MITVTEEAMDYIQQILDKNLNTILMLGYDNSGCCGHKYTFNICPNTNLPDNAQKYNDFIYVAPNSISGLDGSILDLKSEMLDRFLVWDNPKIAGSCGCGNSFQLSGEE